MNRSSAAATDLATAAERPALQGMACVDTSGNPRIPILMEMVAALSRAQTPRDVLREFSNGIRQLEDERGYVSLSTRGLEPGQYRITRLMSSDSVEGLEATDPWNDGQEIPVHEGGFFGEIIRQAYPEIIHNAYLKNDPVVGDALAEYGSVMAIPLFDNGEPLNWAIMLNRKPDGFTIPQLEEIILRGNLVGSTVRNVLVAQELREAHSKIRREVEQIADIQRALLPKRTPAIPGVTISASYQTYDQAGGDYYDFVQLGDHRRWALVIADAAGHGPAAAVLMAMLHTLLHAYPEIPMTPSEVLVHANEHLVRKGIDSSFITAFLAFFDPDSRELVYARAGHPPPLVKDPGSGGAVRRLDDIGSIPLGVSGGVEYEDSATTLEPGQTLVMYTDGITEAMDPSGDMFDVAGIEHALTICTGDPGCVEQSIGKALLAHEAGRRPQDDQTLVAFRVD